MADFQAKDAGGTTQNFKAAGDGSGGDPFVPEQNVNVISALPAGTNYIGKTRLTDGTNDLTLKNLTNAKALPAAIVDGNGDQITGFGGGVQYTEGDTDATITGTVALWEDVSNTLTPISAAKPLPVNIVAGGASGGTAQADRSAFTDGSGSLTPIGAVFNDTPTDPTEEQVAAPRITAKRALHSNLRDASGNEIASATTTPGGSDRGIVTRNIPGGTQGINLTQIGGNTVNAGTGNVGTGTQRVVLASDQPVVPVSGTFWQATQPVSGTVTAGNTAGDVAHDSADSGNPVKIGGKAVNAEPSAVANNDRANFITDLVGKQIILPYANPESFIGGTTSDITGTSNTAVIAAQGSGVRIYVTHLTICNSHASQGTWVNIKDGTTTIWTGYFAPGGGGGIIQLPTPLRLTANTALNAACETSGANVRVSAAGYKGV